MKKYLKAIISRIKETLLGKSIFVKAEMKAMDLSDVLSYYQGLMPVSVEVDYEFKCYSSTDDYNKDFLSIFHSCKRDIFLDYSQKDGHFRV